MNYTHKIIPIIIFILIANSSFVALGKNLKTDINIENENTIKIIAPADLSAKITGKTSFCQNSTNAEITFEGSGGKAPYTFTYEIDGVLQTANPTTGNGNTVQVIVNTTIAKTLTYKIKTIKDIDGNEVKPDITAAITVNELPDASFTFTSDNTCSGTSIQFTTSLSGSFKYDWNFDDSSTSNESNPKHVFTCIGGETQTFNVKLTVTDNSTTCQNTISKNVTVKQAPDATLNGTGSGNLYNGIPLFKNCTNTVSTFTFTNGSATSIYNKKYKISWGDGTPDFESTSWDLTTHTYQIGLWNLIYTIDGSNGCSISKSYIVFVGSNPAVSLGNPGNTNVCMSESLTFPITGTTNNPPGTTYTVTFNDGSATQSFIHPPPSSVTHQFLKTSCGTTSSDGSMNYLNSFYAKIVAKNPCDTSAVSVVPIRITSPPIADFTLPSNSICSNTQTCFTNTATEANENNGNTCSTPKIIWIISPNTGVTLVSGNYGKDFGSNDQQLWTTGSDVICTKFSITGTYTITMIAANRCGIIKKEKTICVESPTAPLFSLDKTQGCIPLTVKATNNTNTTNSCTSISYRWETSYVSSNCGTKSGVTFDATTNPTFNFTEPGKYTIKLTVLNSCSNSQTTTQTVTVNKPPNVSINSIANSCGSASITPISTVNSCGPPSSTLTYAWSFPGGIPISSTSINPGTITYNKDGNYEISLIVTNECGVSTTAKQSFVVNKKPAITNASLSQTICSGLKPELVTLISDPPNATFSWTATATPGISGFTTSGKTNTLPILPIFNSSNSEGTVTYSITPSLGGCAGEVVKYIITVNPSATVTFSPADQSICSGESTALVTLNSTTTGAVFSWSAIQPAGITGVITSGTNTIPAQTLTNSTNAPISVIYKAKATIAGTTTCAGAEYIYTITVNPKPVVSGSLKDTICSGSSFNLSPKNGGGNNIPTGTKYKWSAPVISPAGVITGASGQNIAQPVISQTLINTTSTIATATYSVTPITNDCEGNPFELIVAVNPKAIVDPISNIMLCNEEQNAEIVFHGNPVEAVFKWVSNNVNIGMPTSFGSAKIPAFTATNSGTSPITATITVTTSNESGNLDCTGNPAVFSITVNPTGQVNNPGNQNACIGQNTTINFTTKNTDGITTYEWTNSNTTIGLVGSGIGNISFSPINTGNTILTTTITVIPTYTNNGISCKGTSEQFTITVNPIATVDQPLDQIVCNGYKTNEIKFSGNVPAAIYNWSINNSTIGLPANGTGDISQFTAVNNGSSPIVALITVTPEINGCSGTPKSFRITVNPSPNFTKHPVSSTICLGEKPTLLSVSYTNGTGTPTYQWYSNTSDNTTGSTLIPNETTNNYNPPSAIANTLYYYCVITFPTGGCNTLTSDIAKVTINQKPVISTINKEISSGETFTVIPNSQNGDIVPSQTTYTWSLPVISPANSASGASAQPTPQTGISQTLTNATTGIATVTYTVTPTSGSCVGATFQVIVKVNPPLYPNATINSVTCFGVHDGSIVTKIEGGVPFVTGTPYTVVWNGPKGFTASSASISGLNPGVYSLDITDSMGMKFSTSYTITEPDGISVITNTEKDITCFGAANGEIDISTSGGTGTYKYTWTKNNIAFANTEDITKLSPGQYKITVTDANNCAPKILVYTISEPAALSISIQNKTDIKCFGESTGAVSIDVQGGNPIEFTPGIFDYKYNWTGPNGFTSSNKNLNNISAGNYNLTVTDDSGCGQAFPVVITESAEIVVSASTTPISCYGANNASIQLKIIGGVPPYLAHWDNFANGTFQENLSAGEYTITVTDANNCQKAIKVTIPEASIFKVTPVVKNISCFGANDGSIALNYEGGNESVSFSWSDNSTSGTTRNNIGPGTYTVNINGGNLCLINRTFVIVEPLPLVLKADITDAFDCVIVNGGAIDLLVTGGLSPYRYSWSNGATTEDLTNLSAGNYAVTVTDSIGCVQIAQYVVKRPLPIKINVITKIDYDCTSKKIKAICNSKITGGVPPYQLKWSVGKVSGADNEIMETNMSGTVVLQVTDALGCIADHTLNVLIPNIGIDYQLRDCDHHDYQFNAIVVSELEEYTYSWDFGDGVISNIKNPTHSYQSAGIYKVLLTVRSASSCISEYQQIIDVEFPPIVSINREPKFCKGDSILIYGTGAHTYKWSDGTVGDSILIKDIGNYSVTGISEAGCTALFNFTVAYFDMMNYTIQSDIIEVLNDQNRIHIWSENIPFSNYSWDFGDGMSGQGFDLYHDYDIKKDGFFDVKLKVINPNGCLEEATKRIWISITSIPNTFTPNGDGINDIFLRGWQIEVYNRNGVLIYEGQDGWDGNHGRKPVANDTYFVIVYDSAELGAKFRTNYVTVFR